MLQRYFFSVSPILPGVQAALRGALAVRQGVRERQKRNGRRASRPFRANRVLA